jgi:hypothetical protein
MRIVNEAVGVSEDAYIIAKRLLPMILDEIKDFTGTITDDDEKFIFDFDYTIRVGKKKILIKKIEVELTFNKTNNRSKIKGKNIVTLGLTYHNPDLKSLSNKGTMTYKSEDIIRLGIDFRINTLAKYEQLFRELTNYKEYIPSLAHEIKHFIDSNVEGATSNIGSAVKYGITTALMGMPASDFIYQMYYIHKIENLVRPTQLYAQFMTEKVTKKEFLEKYTSSAIYKILSEVDEVSYEKILQLTANDMGIPNMFMTRMFLEKYLNDLIHTFEIKGIEGIEIEMKRNGHNIDKDSDDLKKVFIDYVKNKVKIKEDSDGINIEKTFKAIIDDMKYVAKNLKRKLAKIYSILPD